MSVTKEKMNKRHLVMAAAAISEGGITQLNIQQGFELMGYFRSISKRRENK